MMKILNIAHRGFSGIYPENTMLAFEKAVEAGADGIETDVHVTKDGTIVICHDEKLDRTTNGTGFIKDCSYRELSKLDAGLGEKIPTLVQLLDYIRNKNIILNIELKNNVIDYRNFEIKVIDEVYKYKLQDRVILSSFNHNSMKKVKVYDKRIKTGLLYGLPIHEPQKYAKKMGADALHPLFSLVMDENMVNIIKKEHVLINSYTVNEKKHMIKMIELGMDGIITNYPDILAKILK